MINNSNLSTDEYIRMNDITDERFLELADIEHKYYALVDKLLEGNWIENEESVTDLKQALSILGFIDKDIEQQLDDFYARLKYSREVFENEVLKTLD